MQRVTELVHSADASCCTLAFDVGPQDELAITVQIVATKPELDKQLKAHGRAVKGRLGRVVRRICRGDAPNTCTTQNNSTCCIFVIRFFPPNVAIRMRYCMVLSHDAMRNGME